MQTAGIAATAPPQFTDASGCADWLEQLPLTNIGPSHERILGELEELNTCRIAPGERLGILELLRGPAIFLQEEQTRRFASKPIPLTHPENEVFVRVVALWDALREGYEQCLQEMTEAPPDPQQNREALVRQRTLWCVRRRIAEHHNAYRGASGENWALLHRTYAAAEQRGIAGEPVLHPSGEGQATCSGTYAGALLEQLANPNEHNLKQMALVSRWIDLWARKVVISRAAAANDTGALPPAVDLAGERGALREPMTGESVRYLDLAELEKSLAARIAPLARGQSPRSMGLGEDVAGPDAQRLLELLRRQWCQKQASRAQPRRSTASRALLCTGIAGIHFALTGKPFKQPGDARGLSKLEYDEIATFGRVSTQKENEFSSLHGFFLEQWAIQEESLAGMRIQRMVNGGSARLLHHQLLALQPTDAKIFMLGMIRWLQVSENLELRAGVRIIPGVPQGIAFRPTGVNVTSDKFFPGIALAAVPALSSPPTLILPAGWYRDKRVIKVYSDRLETIMLDALLERGSDYERVSFVPA